MRVLTIARLAVLRLLRDRANLFFVFVLPMALVLLIGLQFGGDEAQVLAVVGPDDAAAEALTEDLAARPAIVVEEYAERPAALDAVARDRAQAALVLPPDFGAAVDEGRASIEFLARPGGAGAALRPVVAEVVGRRGVEATAAAVAAEVTGRSPAELAGVVEAVASGSSISVEQVDVGGDPLDEEFAGVGRFAQGASSQLVLFVFITSLTAAAGLIQERNLGLVTRMQATPTRSGEIVLGIALGRFGVALFQGVYIMVGALVVFGVDWGDPLGAAAVLTVFSAVSAGAGLLLGSVADNDSQAGGIGVGLGLGLAALGGSMAPLEVFPETMRRIAHVTPHAWANDAFADLVRRGRGVTGILPELAVLAAMAAVLLVLAARRLQRVTAA